MSIAVTAIVGPSRIHRCLLAGAGILLLAAAFAVGLLASAHFQYAALQALLLGATGALLVHAGWVRPKTHRIDISGTGEMVLTVQQGLPSALVERAAVVTLLPGSVVWPRLMLLRCRQGTPGARVQLVSVWRDSVGPDAWRALVVAVLVLGSKHQS